MGMATIKHLQYLLKSGYFDEIAGNPKTDRGYMVASITGLSGANNGSLAVTNTG